jgi:hypothetical protein
MAKRTTSKKNLGTGPISRDVLSSARQLLGRKVIDLADRRDAKLRAEDFDKTIISQEELSTYDPVHGIYIYGQNQLSILIEQVTELPMLDPLTEAYAEAQDEYMPSGPPMSPLTTSYFTSWGFFDLHAGVQKETFGTVVIDLCKFLKVDPGLIHIFEVMQQSRMGIYLHEGISGPHVLLRELITHREIRAHSASGYLGGPGEIWFARILPAPFDHERFDYAVVFTTPYIAGELKGKQTYSRTTEAEWMAYFERNLAQVGFEDKALAYAALMKYGLGRHYWNEYVFLGYLNHQSDAIYLAGFPDNPSSLPHSKEGEKRFGF